jgi:hypothetical protein
MAAPMPREAPVTIAIFPSRDLDIFSSEYEGKEASDAVNLYFYFSVELSSSPKPST